MLIIQHQPFSRRKSYHTKSPLYLVQHDRFSEKHACFSHFPIFLVREGYPENTTHFNQVTVKSALNSRKMRQNLQKKNHVTTLYNVITWFS